MAPAWPRKVWQGVRQWTFFAAGTDQGFFHHMLHVRHHVAYEPPQGTAAAGWARGFSRHWFGPIKPHTHPALEAAYEPDAGLSAEQTVKRTLEEEDPSRLAWLYDFVLRSEPPGDASHGPRSAQHKACSAGQALVAKRSRAIPSGMRWRERGTSSTGATLVARLVTCQAC